MTPLMPLAIAGAYWPVLAWYGRRIADKSDEPWGLVALMCAIAVIALGSKLIRLRDPQSAHEEARPAESISWINLGFGIASIIIYVVTFKCAPNLFQAVLFVVSLWCLSLSQCSGISKAGLLGLLLLSLPVIPSLNFFAGYPTRLIVAQGASGLLNLLGVHSTIEGVMICSNGRLVAVDAPCSGINMLWSQAFVAMLLACLFRLDSKKTFLLGTLTAAFIIVGNVLRTSSLVLFDVLTGSRQLAPLAAHEPAFHVGIGLVIFSLTCALSIAAAYFLDARLSFRSEKRIGQVEPSRVEPEQIDSGGVEKPATATGDANASGSLSFAGNDRWLARNDKLPNWNRWALGALCVVAAVTPFWQRSDAAGSKSADSAVEWPTTINGRRLTALAPTNEESEFAREFPGCMKHFTDGTSSYFVRQVRSATRQLHPSSDCFKGLGYQIEPRPIVVSQDGTRWSAFVATNGSSKYRILERIYDRDGVSATDVSQWFWLASLGKSHGPWFDVTIAEKL